jgi:glutathione S-transferase
LLGDHLTGHEWVAGERYSVADIAVYGYLHVAHEAGYDVPPAVRAWLGRVAARPGYMNDLEPYPLNARPGVGRSTYEAAV